MDVLKSSKSQKGTPAPLKRCWNAHHTNLMPGSSGQGLRYVKERSFPVGATRAYNYIPGPCSGHVKGPCLSKPDDGSWLAAFKQFGVASIALLPLIRPCRHE